MAGIGNSMNVSNVRFTFISSNNGFVRWLYRIPTSSWYETTSIDHPYDGLLSIRSRSITIRNSFLLLFLFAVESLYRCFNITESCFIGYSSCCIRITSWLHDYYLLSNFPEVHRQLSFRCTDTIFSIFVIVVDRWVIFDNLTSGWLIARINRVDRWRL